MSLLKSLFVSPSISLSLTQDLLTTAVIGDRAIQIEQANPGDNPAFDLIGLTRLRNDPNFAGIDGSGFSVVAIDTGIDVNHPLLAPNYLTGYDFLDDDNDPSDPDGHGTHVAGTIGATDESIGVAPGVGLISLRVLDGNGGSLLEVEDALEWVFAHREQYNITAVNLSLGLGFFTPETGLRGDIISDDIRRLENAGVTVVGAAGNEYFTNSGESNRENLAFPAIASTIAVGAVWQDGSQSNIAWQSGSIDYTTGADRITSFSQRLNVSNVVFAPGALITSTIPGAGRGLLAGTSQASPHVAGSVALLQQASLQFNGRLLAPEEVREILFNTGDRIVDGDDEDDNIINSGSSYVRINIYNAIAQVKTGADNFAPPPENNPDNIVSGDSNGTITGAFIAPTIDGSPVSPIVGNIGQDGQNIRPNDVDIYRFELVSPGTVRIETASDLNNPADFDSYIRLFDVNGNEIGNNDDIATGNLFSRLDMNLEPGTYYVGVSGFRNISYNPNIPGSGIAADTGNYTLQFSLRNQDPNGLISGAVEVNLGSGLEPLVFPGVIGTDYGEEVGVSDVDLFRIVAPDNGVLFIDIDTPFANNFVNSYLRLFDENGNEIVSPSDDNLAIARDGRAIEFLQDNNSGIVLENPEQTDLVDSSLDPEGNYQSGNYGHTTDSFINTRVERGKVYYVGVSDFFNQEYNANNLSNRPENTAGGQYELITTFVNNDLDGSITQTDGAIALPIGDRLGVIGVDGEQEVGDRDVDFYQINSGSSGILEISVTSSNDDPVNTVALIFDAEGNRLGLSDPNNSLDSLLRYQIAPNTDYYVAVTGFGNQNFNPFALGSGTGGDTGTYTINGNLIPLEEAGNLVDNTIGSSAVQNLTSGETVFGNVGNDSGFIVGDTDIDIYRFIPNIDSTVNIKTIANEEFSADTYLRVFDGEGNEIAANDNENDLNQGSLIQLDVTAGTQYYIGVNGSSPQGQQYNPVTGEGAAPGNQGNYNLSISSGNDLVTGSTVYRFFRPDIGTHFYTASNFERDSIITNLPNYSYEGESYLAASETADPLTGARPVYRFFNTSTGAHLYTMSEAERDTIDGNLANYNYEGIAYYGYQSDRPGATALYRFYNAAIDAHFYTPSAVERDAILTNLPDYQLEGNDGIAFYVEPIRDI
ncbi:S8 family serine peptidase [Waterburya agarophytonicola K14]|uniref:S8 family serine peptidase n=1 Tax=Waterburya agarophytonicola KI4 TaxID=2874699 RepID=A0A964BQJ0_9CYAN|nr:S8 family serine peptidase [Waterburya agarophytonicola]MCC0177007.1 S8 family serine peptidase [Waterburya agarophytonicola KI4]